MVATFLQIVKLSSALAYAPVTSSCEREMKGKSKIPFLSLELQVTIIGASIRKMLAA